jgi:DtxR family Mn-dependent transcriptional regulator
LGLGAHKEQTEVEKHEALDEYLEVLYHLRERHHSDVKSLEEHYQDVHSKNGGGSVFDKEMLEKLKEQALVVVAGEDVQLTDEGFKRAEQIIRRHRLAERLLADVLHMNSQEFEAAACEFEHVLAEEITEGICILLGHPRTCPHGSPIPEGQCCRAGATQILSAAVPLTEVQVGSTVRVAYVHSLSEAQQHQLTHFDVVPGNTIRLHQLKPAVVIVHQENMFAMESAVAKNIYVWRNWKESAAPLEVSAAAARKGLWSRLAGLF